MPSAASRRLYEDQIPSFMSVFDLDSELLSDNGPITVVDPKMMDMDVTQPKLPSQQQHHHANAPTQITESSDSSPTTTASCTDSSSLSDQSPSSSPDSPVNLIPLSSFAGPTFGGLSSMAALTVSEPSLVRPMTSPGPRRPRNMKGLSIQAPFAPNNTISSTITSEPSSPSFIKPMIPAMKRKPSNLSLKTNSHNPVKPTLLEIPASPTLSIPPMLQRRALKHSTSSPHMLQGLKSSTFGPAGGMTIPTVLERNESGLSEFLRPSKPTSPPIGSSEVIPEEGSPIRAQVANRAAFDFEPFHEIENNEDQKSPGYPEGPIAIYEDNIFLYSEPNAEEASRFDVVINVAREVLNPFEVAARKAKESERPKDASPIPETACSFATAFEYFPPAQDEATTPTAPPKEPEYIHMLWDHNTDIAPDLMDLCEIIERRTRQGKKVLIHCQQGASRSASLIIAYGMYQRPELTVNDAYHAAQARSRWISPNMRLMYCLQDFQKEVSKKRLPPPSAFRPRAGKSPTKHRIALSVDAIDVPLQKEPLTAPLPDEDNGANSPERSPLRPRGNSTPNRVDPVSPGPSSAPSSFSWSEKEDDRDPGKFGRFNMVSISRPPQTDSGFVSSSSSGNSSQLRPPPAVGFPQPPPLSPGFAPPSFSRPPPSPGFAPRNFSRPPPSPGFAPMNFSRPPPSPGFAPMNFSRPPPMGFAPPRMSKGSPPAPLGGLAPITLSRPPLSPGFAPPAFGMPPPSPGFAARRLEKKSAAAAGLGGFGGFVSMHVPEAPAVETQKEQPESPERHVPILPAATFEDDDALMSPRVETMTKNPLHDPFGSEFAGLRLVEQPPTPSDGLFSPRATVFPRDPFHPFARPTQVADPRSPPTLGETPIVRSIDELI